MELANTPARSIPRARSRYWEIDTVRGIAVILMIYFHLMWNLFYYGVTDISVYTPEWQTFARSIGSTFTFLIGLSLAIRREKVTDAFLPFLQRALVIFGSAMLVTIATYLTLGPREFVIFGILHLQAVALLVCYFFARWPAWASLLAAAVVIAIGASIYYATVPYPWLIPLGVQELDRPMADYYPLLPWLGPALLGVAAGKLVYPGGQRSFALPDLGDLAPIRALRWLGRHSLIIYLVHQPIIIGVMFALGLARF